MTDFLLAIGSLVGLLVYASLAVAIYKACTSVTGSQVLTITAWERIGCALAASAIYGSVLAYAAITTPAPRTPPLTVAWGVAGGFAWAYCFLASMAIETPEYFAILRSALWPLAFPLGWLARALVAVVVLGARVPLKLGDAIYRQANRRALTAAETLARQERIAAMEKELGL